MKQIVTPMTRRSRNAQLRYRAKNRDKNREKNCDRLLPIGITFYSPHKCTLQLNRSFLSDQSSFKK
jgi:hypothetical protein